MLRLGRRLRLVSLAHLLDTSRSASDHDQILDEFVNLIASDEEILLVLAEYQGNVETLRGLFKDLIRNGLDVRVNSRWMPSAILEHSFTLEYLLYHRRNELPFPGDALLAYARDPRGGFVDDAQERRMSSGRQPRTGRLAVMLAIRIGLVLAVVNLFSGTLIEKAVKWSLIGLGCMYLMTALAQAITYRKSFGRRLYLYVTRMRHLSGGSLGGPLSSLASVMAAYGLVVMLTAGWLHKAWSYVGVYLLVHACSMLFTRWLPPFVLVLTSSTANAVSLARKINLTILPMHSTSLTQLADHGSAMNGVSRIRSLRRVPGRPWMEVVEAAMEMAKLIVLDTRDSTTAVLDEADAVQRLGYQFKTILVIPDGRTRLGPTEAKPDIVGRLELDAPTLSAEEALSLIRYLRRNLEISPATHRPLAKILESSGIGPRNRATKDQS